MLRGLFAFGWGLVLVSTFLINHFDLFGLRQVWLYLLDRPCDALRFATPGPYRLVRHPLYVGWLFAFWMTPVMTLAHLLFSIATTAYILLAIRFEERDLVREHGETYEEYRRSVPMLVPFSKQARPRPESSNSLKRGLLAETGMRLGSKNLMPRPQTHEFGINPLQQTQGVFPALTFIG